MSAAISLLVILTLSVMIIRTAAVALRLTGVPDVVARFQARSAFTGAGFTTSESEAVVNYPIRRKIIGFLMVLGNLGLVSILGTIVVTFLRTKADTTAVVEQILWLAGMVVVLWFVALNPWVDAVMCRIMGWLLRRTTRLGESRTQRLLQLADGYSLDSHHVVSNDPAIGQTIGELLGPDACLVGLRRADGSYQHKPPSDISFAAGDLLVYAAHDQADNRPFEPTTPGVSPKADG